MTFRGFGGITMPVATVMSTDSDFSDASVKQSTLLGVKTMGQMHVAMAETSLRKNFIILSFSLLLPGFVSALKSGLTLIRRKPQWNSINVLLGITSLLSRVRLILKCIVDNLHSCGNRVERITALP